MQACYVVPVKSNEKISQNFAALSEYMSSTKPIIINYLCFETKKKAERKYKLHFLFQQKSRNCVTAQRIPIKMKGEKNTFQGCRSWAQILANQLILNISTGKGGRLCLPHY